MIDTSSSAKLDPNGDYATVRVTSGAKSIVVRYDEAHRYRRMIRHINALSVVLVLVASCTSPKVQAAKHAAVVCGKAHGAEIAAAIAEYGAKAILTGHVDWAEVEREAKELGVEVGGCAAKEFVAALAEQPEAVAMGAPSVAAQGQAMLERLRAHWGVTDWAVQ